MYFNDWKSASEPQNFKNQRIYKLIDIEKINQLVLLNIKNINKERKLKFLYVSINIFEFFPIPINKVFVSH